MRDGPRRATIAAFATLVVGSAASCTGIDDQLLVVANPGAEQQSTTIFAVTPGDDLDDDSRVLADAVGPLTVVTRGSDGELRYDELGQAWQGELLLAASVQAEDPQRTQRVLANQPGGDATTIAAAAQTEVVMVARGVFVFDDEGCRLATRAEKATEVGKGRCSISDNDRWVASWPAEGGDLEVRDLRDDEVVTTKGNFTQAVALSNDARVLGIDTGTTTSVAKVIDATTGEVVSTGKAATFLQAVTASPDGRAFVLIAERDGIPSIEWVDTDGTTSTIAEGSPARPLLPVNVGEAVDYLALGEELDDSRLYHWAPDSKEPESVMAGELTATGLTPGLTLVTRQVADGLELWSVHDGELSTRPHVVLRTDTSQHLQVDRVLTADGVAHVEVTGATGTSYVRVDTEGDRSAVVMRSWASLHIGAVDGDGTVVLTGSERADDAEQQLLVVGPDDDEATRRAAAETFGTSLVRDGTVYFTELGAAETSVWQVPVSARGGGEAPERLWEDALLGGAAWAQYGGMSETSTVDPVQLAQQQQQQQQQQP
jgi:hypothetical protein